MEDATPSRESKLMPRVEIIAHAVVFAERAIHLAGAEADSWRESTCPRCQLPATYERMCVFAASILFLAFHKL